MKNEKAKETKKETAPVQETPSLEQPKKQKEQKQKVELAKYETYTNLKFIKFAGGVLIPEKEKELEKLEKELKACDGRIPNPKRFEKAPGLTAAFGNTYQRFVKDIPVPDEVFEFVKAQGKVSYYFK